MPAGLFKKARDRQRRRRRAVGGFLLILGVAALAVVLGLQGVASSNHASGGAPSGVDPGVEGISARAFAKYQLPCWALQQASIPVGPKRSRWCKPDTPVERHWVVNVPGGSVKCKGWGLTGASITATCRFVALPPGKA